MGRSVVDRRGGSGWQSALSTRRKQVRSRQCRHTFSGESRKTGEFGKFNVCFPNSSPESAAASECRLGLLGGNVSRQRRPAISAELRGFEDLGRFNLWRPMVVNRTRGSKWMQALPAGSKRVQAQRTSQSPAATVPLSGEPHGRATMPPLKGEVPAIQAVGFELRRPWPLQFMAANGRQ